MFKLLIFLITISNIDGKEYGSRIGRSKRIFEISPASHSLLNSAPKFGFSKRTSNLQNSGIGGNVGPTTAAIHSKRNVKIVSYNSAFEPYQAQVIEVPPTLMPVKILFRSKSSPVYVKQFHIQGEPGKLEKTRSEDEPHIVRHQVIRPVIQELREVIIPFRTVVQEIKPVIEQIQQIIASGQSRNTLNPSSTLTEDISPVDQLSGDKQLIDPLSKESTDVRLSSEKLQPMRGMVLGGALSGMLLDNGLDKVNEYELESNNQQQVSDNLKQSKGFSKRTALQAFKRKTNQNNLGLSPPYLVLGSTPYIIYHNKSYISLSLKDIYKKFNVNQVKKS